MKDITKYNDFLYENTLSTISDFLKAQYNNIFNGANQQLNSLFTDFTKKLDREKNVPSLYQKYLRTNQNTIQNEINKADSIEAVNKVVTDNIKYFYFSLKPVVSKLQNDEFTIEKIFERSRDKRLQKLMSYPEDQFANAVPQYVTDAVLPQLKKDAGLEQTPQEKQQTQTPASTTESIMSNIYRILEADQPVATPTTTPAPATTPETNPEADLIKYKKSAINWFNLTLFDLIKNKMTILNRLGANTGNTVDQLSNMMKGTQNDNAKKMILNKIVNMNKEELENLANSLGLTKEEIGQL